MIEYLARGCPRLPQDADRPVEVQAARKAFFPSSIGLSFLAAASCRELAVTARWGDYAPVETVDASGGKTPVWRRTPREEAPSIPLGGEGPLVRDVRLGRPAAPGRGTADRHVARLAGLEPRRTQWGD